MKILVIAPQPFFQERGTPIAVKMAVEALAKKFSPTTNPRAHIDLIVYKEGEPIEIPGVTIRRVNYPRWLQGIRPGISWKKLLCDFLLMIYTFKLLWRSRRKQYDIIHAVEESAFIAWLGKKIFKIPYIYDMDSSLALQLTERWWWCRPILSILQYLEGVAIRGSLAVAPVCDALHVIATSHGSRSNVLLRDISLLPNSSDESLTRKEIFGDDVKPTDTLILYVGNLESYQGIELLLQAFASICKYHPDAQLIIVGGTPESIAAYTSRYAFSPAMMQTRFLGPRPIHTLAGLLKNADILVSPRTKGNNTPMKIYSYLHSGTAVLATDLPTHTQVLTDEIAVLAAPTPTDFGAGLKRLLENPDLRQQVGSAARSLAEKLYTKDAFEGQLSSLYDIVQQQLRSTETPTLAVENQ
jgi:glycosyltransferase involved in cell wall biosynthesis